MLLQKRLSILFLAICLVFTMSMAAYAHETPDMAKNGSLSVNMTYEGNAVPGGTLTLYQVGKIVEDDGNYHYALTEGFTESGVFFDNLESSELAETLAAYAANHGLTGTAAEIGDDGTMSAKELTLGLYLVVQTKAAKGYEKVAPFLVSIPADEDGTYLYDVDATPKMSTLTKSTQDEPTIPTQPDEPTESTEPTEPAAPTTSTRSATPTKPAAPSTPIKQTLPQTGQLNWPIPVMAAVGLCLLLIGWTLRSANENNHRKRREGFVGILLGAVFVMAALSLFLWNWNEDRKAGAAVEEILPYVEEEIEEADGDETGYPDPYSTEMTEVEIDGYFYIGYISIPSLDLELPVMTDWSYPQLKISPCRYYGSTKTYDLVIAAHNYSRHFGNIKDLSVGDSVTFTDMDGVVSVYEVAEIDVLSPSSVEEMTDSGYALTLFTCTYGGQSRVTVRCELSK